MQADRGRSSTPTHLPTTSTIKHTVGVRRAGAALIIQRATRVRTGAHCSSGFPVLYAVHHYISYLLCCVRFALFSAIVLCISPPLPDELRLTATRQSDTSGILKLLGALLFPGGHNIAVLFEADVAPFSR